MADDPNATNPPHVPNTARNILLRAYTSAAAWSAVHTVAAAAIGGFVAGVAFAKVFL